MDFAVAVATLAAGVIAVLPRVPGFTADDRRRERIRRDVALWRALPASKARKRLGAQIRQATEELVEERDRPLGFDGALRVLTWWCAVTWLALVVSQSITATAPWAVYARQAALTIGIGTGLVAALVALAVLARAARRAFGSLARWWTDRRALKALAGEGPVAGRLPQP